MNRCTVAYVLSISSAGPVAESVGACAVSQSVHGWLVGRLAQCAKFVSRRAAVTGKAANLIPGVVNQPQREKGAREGAHEYQ